MSGGVGPASSDIRLPEESLDQPRRGYFNFRHLIAVAVAVVVSAAGMVSVWDIVFVPFSFIYMLFISKFSFPAVSPSTEAAPVFSRNKKILGIYVSVAAVVGLYLPIAYVLQGILEGDTEGSRAAAPHLFLLTSQVFMEGVAAKGRFSLPVFVFVPVFYNSRRIFTLVEWVKDEFSKGEGGGEQSYGGSSSSWRLYAGRGLAMANMALWCFNLFGFLLPVYLPRAFQRYYSGRHGLYKVKD